MSERLYFRQLLSGVDFGIGDEVARQMRNFVYLIGDPAAMYESLTQRLARIPDDTVLFPGHFYASAPSAPLGDTRSSNCVFAPSSASQWPAMFGH